MFAKKKDGMLVVVVNTRLVSVFWRSVLAFKAQRLSCLLRFVDDNASKRLCG